MPLPEIYFIDEKQQQQCDAQSMPLGRFANVVGKEASNLCDSGNGDDENTVQRSFPTSVLVVLFYLGR